MGADIGLAGAHDHRNPASSYGKGHGHGSACSDRPLAPACCLSSPASPKLRHYPSTPDNVCYVNRSGRFAAQAAAPVCVCCPTFWACPGKPGVVVASKIEMSLWMLLLLLAVVKVPLAALLLWIPLRSDEAMSARQEAQREPGSDEGDGGSRTLGEDPRTPHPRRPLPVGPRRGPHGSPARPSRRGTRHTPRRGAPRRVPERALSGCACAPLAPPWPSRGAGACAAPGRAWGLRRTPA